MRIVSMKIPLYVVSMAIVALLVTSCIKIDQAPSLEIQVLDEDNNPVNQALVGIFESVEEWGMRENPVHAWQRTDNEGKVMFLELLEMNYFILVEKDSLNNLRNEIQTSEELMENRITKLHIHID